MTRSCRRWPRSLATSASRCGSTAPWPSAGGGGEERPQRHVSHVRDAAVPRQEHCQLDPNTKKNLAEFKKEIDNSTKFIPLWVKIAVAIALGLGTMVGWKRIVRTVGEKIGKTHLTYAQGASAELVAMATIGAADMFGLPVSTTHVLSSGVAGTMAANRSGLQWATIRNLLMAWVLTLPMAMRCQAASTGCSRSCSEPRRRWRRHARRILMRSHCG